MKILHISGAKVWGGAENHLENLYYELNKNHSKVEQHILCVKNSEFHQRLKKSNFNFTTVPLNLNLDLRFAYRIKTICRSKRIDLIHIHDPDALSLSVVSDILFKDLPPFILAKKTSFSIRKKKLTLLKYNYEKVKKIICVSGSAKEVAKKSIEDKAKLITIYNGIRFDNKSNITPFRLRDKYNINSNITIVGHIGNQFEAKDLETFIEVVNEIINIRNLKNFFFIQIGLFTDRTRAYKNKIKEYNLENHLKFTGFIENASAFLPQFDTFLFTSQSEGLPQVINEAFYHKTPVVSTNAGGISEIIKNGENGFLTEIGDYNKLADGVIKLNTDDKLVKKFTKRSYEQVIKDFSISEMAKRTHKVYETVLNEKVIE